MNTEKILNLLKQLDDEIIYYGKENINDIRNLEKQLNVNLPKSYVWFLTEIGQAGLPGAEILGANTKIKPNAVYLTEVFRQYGLPKNFVVLQDEGEWTYCLDTTKDADNDCPVSVIYVADNSIKRWKDSFEEYLLDTLQGCIEDIDN